MQCCEHGCRYCAQRTDKVHPLPPFMLRVCIPHIWGLVYLAPDAVVADASFDEEVLRKTVLAVDDDADVVLQEVFRRE